MRTFERPAAPFPNLYDQGEAVEIMVMRYGPDRVPQLAEVVDGHFIPSAPHFPRGGWWYRLKYRTPGGKPMSLSRHENEIWPAPGPSAGETPKAQPQPKGRPMRVNIYAEEMTNRIEIVEKQADGQTFTGLRMYMELPVTQRDPATGEVRQVRGPFLHGPGDDDSGAVTFWGKRDLLDNLRKAVALLEAHYEARDRKPIPGGFGGQEPGGLH